MLLTVPCICLLHLEHEDWTGKNIVDCTRYMLTVPEICWLYIWYIDFTWNILSISPGICWLYLEHTDCTWKMLTVPGTCWLYLEHSDCTWNMLTVHENMSTVPGLNSQNLSKINAQIRAHVWTHWTDGILIITMTKNIKQNYFIWP